jgi:hypothetical protein
MESRLKIIIGTVRESIVQISIANSRTCCWDYASPLHVELSVPTQTCPPLLNRYIICEKCSFSLIKHCVYWHTMKTNRPKELWMCVPVLKTQQIKYKCMHIYICEICFGIAGRNDRRWKTAVIPTRRSTFCMNKLLEQPLFKTTMQLEPTQQPVKNRVSCQFYKHKNKLSLVLEQTGLRLHRVLYLSYYEISNSYLQQVIKYCPRFTVLLFKVTEQ